MSHILTGQRDECIRATCIVAKSFDLRLALVEHHGAILEKDQIMRLLWPNIAVEENNLTVIIASLGKPWARVQMNRYIVSHT